MIIYEPTSAELRTADGRRMFLGVGILLYTGVMWSACVSLRNFSRSLSGKNFGLKFWDNILVIISSEVILIVNNYSDLPDGQSHF